MMSVVERLWPGSTIVCIASGPSLTPDDVNFVRGKARVIVVNNNYLLAPWADVLYAADHKWWKWHDGARDFQGLRYSLTKTTSLWGVRVLRKAGQNGLELHPGGLRLGGNGGYQAINLAVHFGARRIVLLGYDMKTGPRGREHWHEDHPNKSRANYQSWLPHFATLVEPLRALEIEIVNCSRETALTCFPRRTLEQVFPASEVAA